MAKGYILNCVRLLAFKATILKKSFRMMIVALVMIHPYPDQPDQPNLVYPNDNSTNIPTSPTLQVTVSDQDVADELDVSFFGRIKATGSAEDFTLVFIPDPQNESEFYPDIFMSMTDWIVAQHNTQNIVFVTTAGDMVNTAGSTVQYGNADAAIDKFDPAGIPYSVGSGNHDEPTTNFNIYFGISRFSGKPWYGGHYSTTNENSYSLFSASGMDFILINLAYNPSTAVLDWADGILKANSGRRAIVESHSILNTDNSWSNQSVFTALSDNPNLFLMLCGHVSSATDGAAYRSEVGADSHTIHIMEADYQNYPNGGNGYLRILKFSPSADKIYATTYSPFSGGSITTFPDQMEMAYDMEDGSVGPFTLIGTVNNVNNGADALITWPELLTSTPYEWYATVSDGSATVTSATWSFTTTSTPSCIPPSVPGLGAITQPTCLSATGSVVLNGLPAGSWTINPGAINGSGVSTTLTGLNAGTYNFTVTTTIGCTSVATSNVVINAQPLPPVRPGSITGETVVCQGTSQTYSISSVPGATSYTWTLPSGWSGNSVTTSITATAGASSGNISVIANNACGSTTARSLNVTVQSIPAQPGAITGNTEVCQGVTQTYSITPVAGATSYAWTLPSGWSGSSTTASITLTPGATSGNISVTANNACGPGATRTFSITATALPAQAGTITGASSVCQGTSQTYSISSVPGATSYTWTLPSGWSGNSVTTSITATAGATSGNISVIANNACGSSTARSLNITVQTIPSAPGAITGNTTACQGISQTYSISAVPGATSYTWTLPSGWSGSSGSTSIDALAGSAGGIITVAANSSCGSGTMQSLIVNMAELPIISISAIKGISSSTADVISELVSDGGTGITERGICWGNSENPTINDSKTSDGTATGLLTTTIPGVSNGVLYHVRPYATNCFGTGYGSDIKYLHIPTGIDIIQNDGISVFPNPVSGTLNIEYDNDNVKTIRILNSSGVLIGKEEAVNPRQQLDFSKFEYGIYILEFIRPAGKIIRVKVIRVK
jgi:hypothetical protein